jgi:transposase-like protein
LRAERDAEIGEGCGALLAFYAFPADHWRKLRSTNPLERLNREIGRRTDVVHLPQRPSLDPARDQSRDRTEKRVARRPPLPQQPLARAAPSRERREEPIDKEVLELTAT